MLIISKTFLQQIFFFPPKMISVGMTRNNTEMSFLGEQVQYPVITGNPIINNATKYSDSFLKLSRCCRSAITQPISADHF